MQTATAHHCVSSTQSHQRRPEDHARVTRCACGGMLPSTIYHHPTPRLLCFSCCRLSRGAVRRVPGVILFSRRTVASRRGQPSTLRRYSNEHDEFCLVRAVRRTKVGAEAPLPRVPLPPRAVLRSCAQLQKRQGSARPLVVALRSLVVGAGFSAVMRWSLEQICATCRPSHSTSGHR